MKSVTASILVVGLAVVTGCTQADPDSDAEDVGEEHSSIIVSNGIVSNGIVSNGIVSNGIVSNGIVSNGLSPEDQAAIESPDEDGEAARMFVRYAIACALTPSQALDFSWTDSSGVIHDEHYAGELGLAPNWATGPLGLEGQHWVTACMASHVNFYGVHVTISVRSGEKPLRLRPNHPELAAYNKIEGAFWGNLWAPQPYINACYNNANVNNSRAHQRDCATGHLEQDGSVSECGIINVMGSCSSVCKSYSSSRGYYEDCRLKPNSNKRTDLVITTALP